MSKLSANGGISARCACKKGISRQKEINVIGVDPRISESTRISFYMQNKERSRGKNSAHIHAWPDLPRKQEKNEKNSDTTAKRHIQPRIRPPSCSFLSSFYFSSRFSSLHEFILPSCKSLALRV